MRTRYRLGIIFLGIVVLLGMGIHYGASYEDAWPHPTGDQLAEDIDGWDGETVLLIGEVTEVDAATDEATIRITDSQDELVTAVKVAGVSANVESGGTLQVYGELSDAASEMTAESVTVVNTGPNDQRYKLVLSGLSVLLVAGLFLRYWRIDWLGLQFILREGEPNG